MDVVSSHFSVILVVLSIRCYIFTHLILFFPPVVNPFSWADLPTYQDLAIGGPASGSTTPEELVSAPANESTLPASMPPSEQMKLKDKRPADASPCEL